MATRAGQIAADVVVNSKEAEASLRTLQELSGLAQKSLTQLAQTAAGDVGKSTVDATGKLTGFNRQIGEGERALRSFRQEQRLQSFAVREGSGALIGAVYALSLLQQSTGGSSKEMEKMQRSVLIAIAAMHGAEFSAFGLSRGLSSIGFVEAGAAVGKFAGPIGILIALGAGLFSFFHESTKSVDEMTLSMERASRVFREYEKALGERGGEAHLFSLNRLTSELNQSLRNQQAIQEKIDAIDKARKTGGSEEYLKSLDESKKLLEGQLEAEEAIARAVSKEHTMRITARDATEAQVGTLKNLSAIEEFITALTHARALATGEEFNRLSRLIESATKRKNIMEAEVKLAEELAKFQHSSDEEAFRKAKDKHDKQEADATKLAELEMRIAEETTANKFDVERRRARDEFENRKAEIGALTTDQKQQDVDIANAKRALDAKVIDINKREQDDLTRKSEERSRKELEALGQEVEAAGRLARALSKGGDDFFSRLAAALQLALEIEKAIQTANASDQGSSITGLLNIGAGIASFAGLFDSGGYTGAGARYQPAGIVHRGEYVFEKPIVDRYLPQLTALRSAMSQSTRLPGYAYGGMVSALPSAQSSLPPIVVILQGTLEGQTFLRKHMPGFQKFDARKKVAA